MATLSYELPMRQNFLTANLDTARQVLGKIGVLTTPSDPANQTNKECLAIAALFIDPTRFKDPFQRTEDPVRLALILRKIALEKQAVDLAFLDNDGIRQTKILPFMNTANEISRILSQPQIEPGILEKMAIPIYIDDPEFDKFGVSPEKIEFLSTQETSIRRSLIIDSLSEIEK